MFFQFMKAREKLPKRYSVRRSSPRMPIGVGIKHWGTQMNQTEQTIPSNNSDPFYREQNVRH